MAKAKAGLHTTIDKELLDAARRKRKRTGRSIAHVVEEALRRWVEEDPPEIDPVTPVANVPPREDNT